MCGIIGEYFYKRSTFNKHYVKECLKSLTKSSLEDQCQWNNGKNYQVGFSRLPIRDLTEKGKQPMFSEDGRFSLCLNGEVYNVASLKQQLKPFRPYFKSMSDTEVVLYSLIHLGVEECLKQMDGIFAFSFYDNSRNILVLARDRVGTIPLYVGYGRTGIVFGSQYDHVINHEFINDNGFDHKGIYHYLYLGYMPENEGVIKSAGTLPHGHYLQVSDTGYTLNCYYRFPFKKPEEKKKVLLEDLLLESVKSQMVSSVPVGTFLSGGVDSRLITRFANDIKRVKAFTIGVNEEGMNESSAAFAFTEKMKIDHHCRNFSCDDFKTYADLHVKAFSEPFADFSSIPMLMLAKTASRDITVALTGDGGDELFWGYNRNIKALRLMNYYNSGGFERKMKLIISKLKDKNSVEFFRHWNAGDFVSYYYSTLAISGATKWLPEIMENVPERPFFYPANLGEDNGERLSVEENMMMVRKMEVDIHLQRMLQKVDRTTRYFNVEVRIPFLGNTFLDNAGYFSHTDCIDGETGKMNLKKLLYQLTGDASVMDTKRGFTIPIHKWLRAEMQKEVVETVMDMPSKLAIYFNRRKLGKMLQYHNQTNSSSTAWFVWALYALVKWNDEYNVWNK